MRKLSILALLALASLLFSAFTAVAPAAPAPAGDAAGDTATATATSEEPAATAEGEAATTEGEAASGEKFLIGMSQANKGEPWRQAMNDQIAAAAAQYPELEVVFADAAQNNAKQVADVENFIQQGIDLLIISPNEAAPLTDVVAKAYDQGIPVIVLDRKVNGDKFTMWIGADNQLIGRQAGEFIAQWCKDQGHAPCNVIEIRGLEGATPAKERGDGFREGIAGNPDVEIIASQNADWLREKAIPVSQAMFQANPDVHVVYAHNDPMGEAAVISAQNAGLDLSKIAFVGIDALPTPDGGIKSVMDGRLTVTYVYPTGGAQAIDWARRILEDQEEPPKTVVLETEQVDSTNAADLYTKYGGK
jgi:ribose transport system substrate-binding protein